MPYRPKLTVFDEESAKFELFLKAHEIKQINQVLRQVMRLPKAARERWLRECGEFVAEGFDSFIDESNEVLDGLQLDSESMILSKDLVVTLRESLNMVHGILQEPELES